MITGLCEIQEEFCQASLEPKLGQRHWAHVARMRNNMKMGALTMFVSMS